MQRPLTSLAGLRMAPRSPGRQKTEKGLRDVAVRRTWTAGLVSRAPFQAGSTRPEKAQSVPGTLWAFEMLFGRRTGRERGP